MDNRIDDLTDDASCRDIERSGISILMVAFFLVACVLSVVDYLDDDDDEFYEDEGNGLIRSRTFR